MQRLMDDLSERHRDARIQVFEARNLSIAHLGEDHAQIVALGGASTAQHFVGDRAERVDVRARIDRIRRERLLRRHVLWCSQHRAGSRETLLRFGALLELCDAKVQELHDGAADARRHEYVVGFKISMDDAEAVSGFESEQHLKREIDGLISVKRPNSPHDLLQRFALEEFHHQEGPAVHGSGDVVYDRHVRTANARGDSGLTEKPLYQPGTPREFGVQKLERDGHVEHLVTCFVDAAHAAIADQPNDAISLSNEFPSSWSDHANNPSPSPSTTRSDSGVWCKYSSRNVSERDSARSTKRTPSRWSHSC